MGTERPKACFESLDRATDSQQRLDQRLASGDVDDHRLGPLRTTALDVRARRPADQLDGHVSSRLHDTSEGDAVPQSALDCSTYGSDGGGQAGASERRPPVP